MEIFTAMIALGPSLNLSGTAIRQDLVSNWPDLQVSDIVEEQEGIFALRIAKAQAFLARMPTPIPWSDLEGPCATSILWPNAERELRSHNSHLVITASGELPLLELAKLLAQVAAAVVGTCSAVIGVYWGSAALVIPARLFREVIIKVLPSELPMEIWVDFRVGRNEQGLSSGFTQGLSAFGLMEIETENASEPPGELRSRLRSIACYLLEEGPVIQNGDTIGENANQKIRVVHAPSVFGHKGTVMRLNY